MSLSNAMLSCPATCRGLVVAVLILLSSGCGETSKSPEDPEILGVPPDTAYLGVDYSYNFGAAGGGNQLKNYSLSNNPSWLALETTTNKARPGIVLRGQPGISGGGNGEADLGSNESIRITTNDGSLLGDRDFEINVKHNALSVVGDTITEGQSHTPDVDKDEDAVCEMPDMDVSRQVEVRHRNLRSDDESDFSSATRTYTTRPALLRVDLDQPSVEPVSVRFKVSEDKPFAEVDVNENKDVCSNDDNSGDESRPCEYEDTNRAKAIFGEDFLLNGNDDRYGYDATFPEPPEYIEFIDEKDEEGTGVLTFEPGKTTCFVPIWVHDDDLPETTERFDFELREVTEGLASKDEGGANPDGRIEIEDETPTVSFKEERLVVTRGESRTVKAELDRPNDTGDTLRAGVEWVNDAGDPVDDVEACFGDCPDPDDFDDGSPLTIEFQPGSQEAEFKLRATTNGDPKPLEDDETFEIGFSDTYQFGREFAAVSTDDTTEVTINEWADDLTTDFSLETLVAGELGEVYAAGTDGSELAARSINRLGEEAIDEDRDSVELSSNGTWPDPEGAIELVFDSRDTGTSGSPEISRYLGLGYTAGSEGWLTLFSSSIDREDDEPLERSSGADDLQWQYGTDTDDLGAFQLGGMSVSNEGDLSLAGTGEGDDSIRLLQVDNNTDSSTPEPELRWERPKETGGTNTVVGLVSSGLSGFSAVGSTRGTVEPDDVVGIEDFFFFGAETDGSEGTTTQFGSEKEDKISAVSGGSTRVWLGGDGDIRYELDDFDAIEADSPREEGNAFVLVTSGSGSVQGVRNFAGSETEPVPASVDALDASGNAAAVAGQSTESGVPYLSRLNFRRNPDDDEDRISLDWRIEVEGAEEILDVSFFDERKIFVGYRRSNDDTAIRLYDLHGNQLSQ